MVIRRKNQLRQSVSSRLVRPTFSVQERLRKHHISENFIYNIGG